MKLSVQLSSSTKMLVLTGIALISFVMHFRHFNKEIVGIHAWRQTQTQTIINNFYEEDLNILDPKVNVRGADSGIFRMEFPLMQWLVAVLYKIFGMHMLITRLCMFVIGLFSCYGMFKLLKALSGNESLGLIAAWAFNFSPSFYYYTINPLPDNLALCCGIWGLAFFFRWTKEEKATQLFICGFLLCIGTLCKLPFILYYSVPVIYLLQQLVKNKTARGRTVKDLLIVCAPVIFPFAWYIAAIPQWQTNGVTRGMLDNGIPFSLMIEYLLFNLSSNLPELLINYASMLFFIAGFYYTIKLRLYKHRAFPALLVLSICLGAYYLFEMNMIARTHDYYLFPFYPVLFMLVSYGAFYLITADKKILVYLSLVCIAVLPLTAWLRMHNRWNLETPGYNKDLLVYKEELRAAVPDSALCVVGNDESYFIHLYFIHKKGWVFMNNDLKAGDLAEDIKKGAAYLYSDSRELEEKEEIKPFLTELILERGSIRVYRLK